MDRNGEGALSLSKHYTYHAHQNQTNQPAVSQLHFQPLCRLPHSSYCLSLAYILGTTLSAKLKEGPPGVLPPFNRQAAGAHPFLWAQAPTELCLDGLSKLLF